MTEQADAAARSTRDAYREGLLTLMARDPRVVCLDTDTGLFNGAGFGPAADRYLNIGIAEQTAMGVAAGLAAAGRIPFVNTMAAFAAARAVEAVKVDIAYNDLPVRIAATHSGLAAGHLGPTHHALEDLAVMRALPNMTVVVPADAAAAEAAVDQSAGLPGPLYLRLGRSATPAVPAAAPPILGRVQPLLSGPDAVVVACGPYPVRAALTAAAELADEGIGVSVLNMHTVKPFDTMGLLAATERCGLVVTVEEHWRAGGLGAAVSESLAELVPVRVVPVCMPDVFASYVGPQPSLLERYGITAAAVAARIRSHLHENPGPASRLRPAAMPTVVHR